MTETKFTKGPWQYNPAGPADNKGMGICALWGEPGSDEQLANIRLIAKSPCMYEMLAAVRNELYQLIDEVNDQRASKITSTTENEPDYHDYETLHLIDDLLAEVRGEK